jgi:putative ABC transport system permease protein
MSVARVLLAEIRHRLLSFLLGLMAVTAAVALLIALVTMGRASNVETKRLMRNLGFNLLLVPRDTDMADFWAADFAPGDMPEEYVSRLAETRALGVDHYVAVLQRKIEWQGHPVLLTGLLPENHAVDAPGGKEPMGYKIERGTCLVGYVLAQRLGLKPGDTLELPGKKLRVDRRLLEDGSKEDIRLYAHLRDVQDMLGVHGRINTIQALGCLCYGTPLSVLRDKLAGVLPDVQVVELRNIATARAETRHMVEQQVGFIVAAVLAVCAAWVGLLALLNVRERRQEIGILRALGFGSGRVAALFLGRAALIGLLGAAVGFVLGTWLALHFGPGIFKLTFGKVHPAYDLIGVAAVTAPVIAMLASFVPAMAAVTQDPAVSLREA